MVGEIEKTNGRPQIGGYVDFRAYLRDMLAHLKATRRITYRRFAQRAGFSSASFLTLVIQGKRNLSADSIGRFARALELTKKEREAFEAMVLFGQATGDDERNHYYRRLQSAGVVSDFAELGHQQYEVYSLWYAMPIREMVGLPDFREDPAWIATRLEPRITPSQARRALEVLEHAGLLVRDERGELRQAEPKLSAVKLVQPLAVRNYHRAMLDNAVRSLEALPADERNLTSLTIGLTAEQYEEACARVAAFQRELLNEFDDAKDSGAAAEIYVLGCQLVPLTRRKS